MADEQKQWARQLQRNCKRAAIRGDRYTLCDECCKQENNGQPATPGCTVAVAIVKETSLGWSKDGTVLVACFVAQACRNMSLRHPSVVEKIAAGKVIAEKRLGKASRH